jgi:putative transposase
VPAPAEVGGSNPLCSTRKSPQADVISYATRIARRFRGLPRSPITQTQGKIERWHQTLKNRILLEHSTCPATSNARSRPSWRIKTMPSSTRARAISRRPIVYFGQAETILLERERIKRQTIANCRLQHQLHAA